MKDGDYKSLSDNERITKIGRFLRKTSLDELPQLFNVLKGEMSLVGPRPLLEEYLLLYSSEHAQRHLIRPGVTGLAQINGRNKISWEQKFDLDIWYLNHLTLLLDLKIILKTFIYIFKYKNVNKSDDLTMNKFTGY